MIVWFAVAFGLAVPWVMQGAPQSRIVLAGFIALAAAAIPWLAYRPLVKRLAPRQSRESR